MAKLVQRTFAWARENTGIDDLNQFRISIKGSKSSKLAYVLKGKFLACMKFGMAIKLLLKSFNSKKSKNTL